MWGRSSIVARLAPRSRNSLVLRFYRRTPVYIHTLFLDIYLYNTRISSPRVDGAHALESPNSNDLRRSERKIRQLCTSKRKTAVIYAVVNVEDERRCTENWNLEAHVKEKFKSDSLSNGFQVPNHRKRVSDQLEPNACDVCAKFSI